MARPRRFTSRQRRPIIWGGATTAAQISIAASTSTVFTVLSNTDVKARTSPTISRIRGLIGVRSNSLSQFIQGSIGILVAEQSAVAAGSAALPNPDSDFEAPWLWWNNFIELDAALLMKMIVIDSKAQRKLKDSMAVVLIVRNAGINIMQFAFGVRFLLKD